MALQEVTEDLRYAEKLAGRSDDLTEVVRDRALFDIESYLVARGHDLSKFTGMPQPDPANAAIDDSVADVMCNADRQELVRNSDDILNVCRFFIDRDTHG